MVDPDRSPNIDTFVAEAARENINVKFIHGSDLECPLVQTEFLFIDTWHVYGQLKRELARWHSHVTRYIAMHDTEVDGVRGETVRRWMNARAQSARFNMPVDEIKKGLKPAIDEFLLAHPEWKTRAHYRNNNGLTILERV